MSSQGNFANTRRNITACSKALQSIRAVKAVVKTTLKRHESQAEALMSYHPEDTLWKAASQYGRICRPRGAWLSKRGLLKHDDIADTRRYEPDPHTKAIMYQHEGKLVRRRLSELESQLEYHDRHYHCRHTRESTEIRKELVRQIHMLIREVATHGEGTVDHQG
jgi:hypothetical protein